MKILTLNGSPSMNGFSTGTLDMIATHLETQGAVVESIRLADRDIGDCRGCFSCLKTGVCVLKDDMTQIIDALLAADGYVIASPVRNGHVTACYKRFYERITYTLGFPLLLEDKHCLGLSSVGYMGGRSANKRLLCLQDVFHARSSGFLFFSVGIRPALPPSHFRKQLESGANRLMADIRSRRRRQLSDRITFGGERWVMKTFMFRKHPDVYANVLSCWRQKGYA